ncbi:MAG: T9SS type A sorting domain-containing protein [Flavobacteriales bacterium]
MKRIYITGLNLIFATFTWAQTFQVTVNGGFGSGSFQAGEIVHVFANQMQNTQVFDQWVGEVEFEYANEWHGRFIMPAQDVVVSASYRNIPVFSIDIDTILFQGEPKQVFYYFPQVVRGTIFLFHEFAGRAQDWLFRAEYNRFLIDAVADSFAVVFFSAGDLASKSGEINETLGSIEEYAWNVESLTLDENVDLQLLQAIINNLKGLEIMEANPKLYAVGMGQGAIFAQLAANVLDFRAISVYGAAGLPLFNNAPGVPTQWMLCENDESEITGMAGNEDAEAAFENFQTQDICSRIYMHTPSPLYPGRILKDPSFEPIQVNNIFQELINASILLNNRALVNGNRFLEIYNENPEEYLTINGLVDFQRAFIAEQIDIAYAAHQFYSDLNRQTLEFFKSYCGIDTVFETVGIEIQKQFIADIILYPNPTESRLNFRTIDNLIIDELRIFDLQGRLIKHEQRPNIDSIDVSELYLGTYVIQIITSKGILFKRFIKG